MTQYKTQYGTVFAVKEHNGSPAIMCRAEVSETWSLSSMITPFTPGAWTAEELQAQLDNWAATKGWQPVEAPASGEAPEIVDEGSEPDEECPYLQPLENSKKYSCQCALCGDKFVNREICNKSFRGCGWYLDQQEKDARQDDEEEIPATEACQCRTCEHESCFAHGCTKECPANAEESCLTTRCPEYREKPQADANPTPAAGDAPPCAPGASDAQPLPSPNADAGAKTGGNGDDTSCACTGCKRSECTCAGGRNVLGRAYCDGHCNCSQSGCTYDIKHRASPTDAAPASPADAGAAAQSLSAAGPASLAAKDMNVPAFDYSGLDADTAEKLRGITDRVMELYQNYAWGMAYQVGRAHDLLCGDGGSCETVSQLHKANGNRGENTFTAWCAYIGVERRSAYNLLNAYRLICKATPEQQRNLQLAPAKLLYEAGKKDVPDQLADAVMNGDVTKTKQFLDAKREWQAKLDAEHAAREQAEQQRDEAVTHIQAARDMQIDTARERDAALRRAAEAENRAAGAQKLAEQRGDENTALKAQIRDLESRPVEVAVAQPGEDQIEAWRKEGEDRAAAALQDRLRKADQAKADAQRQVNALQTELATARPDADACQRTADTLYETAENLRILLRTQLKQAQLSPTAYGKVVAHVLQVARTLLDTVRVCAPDGYDIDSEEDDDFE